MKKHWKKILGIWIAGALLMAGLDWNSGATYLQAAPASTDDLQSQIDATEEKQSKLKDQKAQVEATVQSLHKNKTNIQKFVQQLDRQVEALEKDQADNEKAIQDIQEQIDSLDQELSQAQAGQQEQYDTMKKRIKFIYENSGNNFFEYLLESHNLADLFSREEYIDKIMTYDQSVLSKYQSVVAEIQANKDQVSNQLLNLRATRQNLDYEEKAIQELQQTKYAQVKVYQGLISKKKGDANDYAEQIQKQEDQMESLLEKQRAQQTAKDGSKGKKIVPTTGEYAWPVDARGTITSTFGYRVAPTAGASTYHKGIDIAVSMGTSVLATKAGTVTIAQYSTSAGNYIAIYHGNGVYSYYMHNSSLQVKVGDRVKKGQVIAKSGSTGFSTGPHLHFGLFANGNYVNPLNYVKQ